MRVVMFLIFAGAALISCKNEPYDDPNLIVSTFVNKDSSNGYSYIYRAGHIYTFKSSVREVVNAKFIYIGDILVEIQDSVATHEKITTFSGWGTSTVIDSTILYTDTLTSLYSIRTVNYNTDGKVANVDLKIFQGDSLVEQNAELTWEDNNVTKLVTTNVVKGTSLVLTIGYDDKSGVYLNGSDYVYTLPLQKLYWLSKNNPVVFNDGGLDKKYRFNYNKFNYPESFRTEKNTLFNVTYSTVR